MLGNVKKYIINEFCYKIYKNNDNCEFRYDLRFKNKNVGVKS